MVQLLSSGLRPALDLRWLSDVCIRIESNIDLLDRCFALRAHGPDAEPAAVLRIEAGPDLDGTVGDEREDALQLHLLMLLQEHGRFGLHANGAVLGQAGCLIVGPAGSGKTTLALALFRAGWRLLGDDVVLLRERGGEVLAAALRRRARCTAATLGAFSELDAVAEPARGARGKRAVDLERARPGGLAAETLPRVLLFPERTSAPESRLAPLDRTSALTRLIAQSAGWGVRRESSARQLATLGALVTQAECLRFLGGADLLALPERAAALLAGALTPC